MTSLELQHVKKSFLGRTVVDELSLTTKPGGIVSLIGPNGAGKTTTLHMILGLIRPDSGSIRLLGESDYLRVRDRVGYLPEQRGLYQEEELESCLLYFLALKGVPRREREKRLSPWIERFGLHTHRKKKISQLSKGMQRKAQFIVALAHDPEFLILDEPFSGLDVSSIALAKSVMKEQAALGKTILMSTHEMYLVEELADFVLLLHHGKVALEGVPEEVRHRFGSPNSFRLNGKGRLDLSSLEKRISSAAFTSGKEEGEYLLEVSEGHSLNEVLGGLVQLGGYNIERVSPNLPTLEEIFIRLVSP